MNLPGRTLLDRLRHAIAAADSAAMVETLAEDVTLRVAVHDVPFEGRAAATQILGAVLGVALRDIEVLETIDHPGDADGGGAAGFVMFRAHVGSHPGWGDGLLIARPDGRGLIGDLTVFLRPLSVLQALDAEMGRLMDGPRPGGD